MIKFFTFSLFVCLSAMFFGAKSADAQKKPRSETNIAARNSTWRGEWKVPSRYTPATLKIVLLSNAKFKFTAEAANGANSGVLEGVAIIKGSKAYFTDRRRENGLRCRMNFTHKGNSIEVDQNGECNDYGLNITFAHEYFKGKQPLFEQDFVDRQVFPNLALDNKFKSLVGKDYENFLDAFHLINENKDLDNFGAKVFSACVLGNCPWDAGIIMFNENGQMWAAVIKADTDPTDGAIVRYYSNVENWTNRVPETILNWVRGKRENNEGLTILYKSRAINDKF